MKFCISYCNCSCSSYRRKAQFAHQVRITLVSQLISTLLRAPKKLLKYVNGTANTKQLVPEALVEFFKFYFEFK